MNRFNKVETTDNGRKFFRVEQAADYLGVSKAHVYRLAEKRLIPHYKSRGGKCIYFATKDLEDYITHTYVMPESEIIASVEKKMIKETL